MKYFGILLVLMACLLFAFKPLQQKTKARFSFLALGDSYTIGESVTEQERWPNQLVTTLRNDLAFSEKYNIEKPHIIAQTGWTTDELQKGIAAKPPKGNYSLVSLLIGVNNQYRGYPTDVFRKQLKELIAQAIGYANKQAHHVIVVSIPDWGVTPFGSGKNRSGDVSKQIDIFNAIVREESSKAGVRYIDITGISRNAKKQPDLVAADGLHPSGKMYRNWVDIISPQVKSLFPVGN